MTSYLYSRNSTTGYKLSVHIPRQDSHVTCMYTYAHIYIKRFSHVSAMGPRKEIKNPRSCCVIDLGRIGLVMYMLYQSEAYRSQTRCPAMPQYNYPKPNRPAARPQVVGGGRGVGHGRAFHSGRLRFKDWSF